MNMATKKKAAKVTAPSKKKAVKRPAKKVKAC